MRRAVAACTSPEVFFNRAANADDTDVFVDALDFSMESFTIAE